MARHQICAGLAAPPELAAKLSTAEEPATRGGAFGVGEEAEEAEDAAPAAVPPMPATHRCRGRGREGGEEEEWGRPRERRRSG